MTFGIRFARRLCLVGLLALVVASCQTRNGMEAGLDSPNASAVAATPETNSSSSATAEVAGAQYYIEFRSRYALSYGHSYVVFGPLDANGNRVSQEVAGLHPASDNAVPYMIGHVLPVPAETGWSDGDLEDEYMSANWIVTLDENEYRKVVSDIRKLQRKSPSWHAALYNCNAFVAEIARSMGYKAPFIWLKPRDFITKLRQMNGGPNAIGTTRPAA